MRVWLYCVTHNAAFNRPYCFLARHVSLEPLNANFTSLRSPHLPCSRTYLCFRRHPCTIGNAQMVTRNNFQTVRKQYNRLISAVWRSSAEWQRILNANGNGNYCDKQYRCGIKLKKNRVRVNGWIDFVSTASTAITISSKVY